MHTEPLFFDYFARTAIVLLNSFERVQTSYSCSGHLQEGNQRSGEVITHYIPGFQHHEHQIGWDAERGCIVETPERFEIDGIDVTLPDLIWSTYHRNDMLFICPLEEVYEHEPRHLHWTGIDLSFSRFDTDEPKTKELRDRLEELYREQQDHLGLILRENGGFHAPELRFPENEIARLVEVQRANYRFWEEIERVCKETS